MNGLRIIFDGPPGPTGPRFVECENNRGESLNAGLWSALPNQTWELALSREALEEALK